MCPRHERSETPAVGLLGRLGGKPAGRTILQLGKVAHECPGVGDLVERSCVRPRRMAVHCNSSTLIRPTLGRRICDSFGPCDRMPHRLQ
jgi:hypothetical protein